MLPNAPEPDTLTLTFSTALARALRSDYALGQRLQGRDVWEVPAIHSLRSWCRQQWLQTWPVEQLLHDVQELALWQRVIEADTAGTAVIGVTALARQARAALRLVMRYRLDAAQLPCYTDEQRAFARWQREVCAELARQGWICEAELPLHTAALIRAGRITAPRRVRVYGDWPLPTPAEEAVLDALCAAGSELCVEPPAHTPAVVESWSCADDTTQFRALAWAVRARLLQLETSNQPPPRILIACPDLEVRRERLEATLRPVLAPWLSLPGDSTRAPPWRFAEGRALAQQPLIAVALAICGLRRHDNRMDELSRVLLASVLWSADERRACAAADYRLRREGGMHFSLPALLDALDGPPKPLFQQLLAVLGKAQTRALPSAWVAHFEARLAALGWPGQRSLPSPEFQARERWAEALATLSAMDGQLGSIAHSEALAWLREIIASRPFEPRADSLQPIEILPLEQAAGLPAEHVFVLDASDEVLPGPCLRQPFLAREALAAVGVPAATPVQALADARRMAQALCASAGKVTLCLARTDERGALHTPTTVFGATLDWRETTCDEALTAAERVARAGPLCLPPTADPVPPVADPVAEGVSGGVAIFRDYVEAPFFAYCRHRLGIEPLPEPGAGLDASAQGSVIHAVLEAIWRELRSQAELQRLDDDQLGTRLDPPLDRAMARYMPADRYGRMLRQIERARLRDLLLQWLRHERRREEAFEAIGFEREAPLNFEGLDLRLRIDRVDRVHTAGGERYLILDYKTGRNADIGGWETDRFHEPQLPLYATASALGALGIRRVDGIGFAHIRDGHPALAAATNWRLRLLAHERFKHIENWDGQLAAWRERLSAIAHGFLAGEAGLDPDGSFERSFNAPLLDLLRDPP